MVQVTSILTPAALVGQCSTTKPLSCSSALQLVPSCSSCGCSSGTCNAATGDCGVANLVATLTRTTTVLTYDSANYCNYNVCNYEVKVSNSGTAPGTVGKRVVSDGFEQIYNQVVNPSATVDLGQGWSASECNVDLSYSVNIYDDGGSSIGSTSFTCLQP